MRTQKTLRADQVSADRISSKGLYAHSLRIEASGVAYYLPVTTEVDGAEVSSGVRCAYCGNVYDAPSPRSCPSCAGSKWEKV